MESQRSTVSDGDVRYALVGVRIGGNCRRSLSELPFEDHDSVGAWSALCHQVTGNACSPRICRLERQRSSLMSTSSRSRGSSEINALITVWA